MRSISAIRNQYVLPFELLRVMICGNSHGRELELDFKSQQE